MMKPLIAAATLLAFTTPALAQQQQHPTPPADSAAKSTDKFAKHDTNKDGALSIAEAKVADASVTDADFAKFDADASKALSEDEFAKWLEAKAPAASAPGQ